MKRGREILFILMAVLAFGGVGRAGAETPSDAVSEEAPAPVAEPEGEVLTIRGMQVFIDAKSGQLRPPTAKEAALMTKLMEQMFGKRVAKPTLNVDKNGIGSAELDESMMEYSVVRIEADGSLTADCVDGASKAREFVEAASQNGGGGEEE